MLIQKTGALPVQFQLDCALYHSPQVAPGLFRFSLRADYEVVWTATPQGTWLRYERILPPGAGLWVAVTKTVLEYPKPEKE